MAALPETIRVEPRWPVMLTSVAVLTLLVSLPERIRAVPGWMPYLITMMLNMPMAALAITTRKRRWLRIESVVLLVFFASVGLMIDDELYYLVITLIRRSTSVDGVQLLASNVAMWASNILGNHEELCARKFYLRFSRFLPMLTPPRFRSSTNQRS